MLLVTGTLKGKTYNDETLSAREFIDMFALPINPDDEKIDEVIYEMGKHMQKKDRFNQLQHARGIGLPAYFSGTHSGGTIQIRYYESLNLVPAKNGGQSKRYMPEKISKFSGNKMNMYKSRDLELLVYYMLHYKCGNSPFRRPTGEVMYSLYDPNKVANEKMASRIRYNQLFNMILEENPVKLRRIAKGIKVKSKSIGGINKMTPAQVQSAMIDLLEEFPDQFEDAYRNTNNHILGVLQDAIDQKVLVQRASSGGNQFEIHWNVEINGGGLIVRVPRGQKPLDALAQYVATNDASLFRSIQTELDKKETGSALDSKKSNLASILNESTVGQDTVTLSQEAVKSGEPEYIRKAVLQTKLVFFDEKTLQAYWMKGGSPDYAHPLFKAQSAETWTEELQSYLATDEGGLRKAKQKLRGVLMQK